DLVQHAPVMYQDVNGVRRPVEGQFVIRNPQSAIPNAPTVFFAVGPYDHTRPLVIDPLVLGYSTFLGGGGYDGGQAIAVDGAGSAYVTGLTSSADFPATPGAFDNSYNGGPEDIFAAKLSPDGRTLLYGTYLGGSNDDEGYAIAVDGEGSAYIGGFTYSP